MLFSHIRVLNKKRRKEENGFQSEILKRPPPFDVPIILGKVAAASPSAEKTQVGTLICVL